MMFKDPRPLTGEPLALDLVNTEWFDDERRDLLADVAGLRVWLRSARLPAEPADEHVLRHVRAARSAIRAVLEHPADAAARDRLNGVLAHGRVAHRLGPDGPVTDTEVGDPARRVAWLAARDLLRLLADHPDRVRGCASGECLLHFLDTSRSGRRQWCSMEVCGNRAKARRHYARSRG